ncbi:hypothetical protein [Streptomyces zaomyceticus]|uniref:hypothetical protein n=1 Tax=Streptomyces zaomyceticus TaxID=68286 RepID=UPI00342299B8
MAYGSTAVFLKADEPTYRDTYEFGGKQGFVATTDGTSFLGTPRWNAQRSGTRGPP